GDSVAWVEAPTELLPARRAAPVVRPAGKRPFPTWVIPASALPLVALLAVIAFGPGAANEGGRATPTGLSGGEGATAVPAPTAPPPASPAPTLTPTPVEAAEGGCPGLRLFAFSKKGNEVSWTIDNSSGADVRIVSLDFKWPEGNPADLVSLDGRTWLEQADLEGMLQDVQQGQNPVLPFDERLGISQGDIRGFSMRFTWADVPGKYELTLVFDSDSGTCELLSEW
ncbi:MAG: hypothetical protein ACRDHG_03585, partial [Anaerolineales bacterium]